MSDDINLDELAKNERIPFEKMYQYFVQEWRKDGLPDPTKEEVLHMLEHMEKTDGSVKKYD